MRANLAAEACRQLRVFIGAMSLLSSGEVGHYAGEDLIALVFDYCRKLKTEK
jgi:hypothetical protein